jgi:hypothetical protein
VVRCGRAVGEKTMKKRTILVSAGCLLLAAATWAQEGEMPGMPTAEEMQQAMEKIQPGPHHEQMAKLVGKWKATARMWFMPDTDPMVIEGTAEITSLLEGRYFRTVMDSTMMGMPFQGIGIDGYDNVQQKHVGAWIDTMGTGIMHYEGHCSDDHKVVTTHAELDDPMTGQRVKMRQVTTMIDANRFKYEAYAKSPDGEGEMKVMEVVYTRM